MRPGRLLLLFTTILLALAAWVSRGALALTDAGAWPGRIGILPSRWAPIVLALVFGLALWRKQRAILLVLLIPAIFLLPWIPVRLPAVALIWTGHTVLWGWIATTLLLVIVAGRAWSDSRALRRLRDPRFGSLAALVLAFVLYCLAACVVSAVVTPRSWPPLQVPGGDEPHYLVITQSLLKDGDLQIENNHQQGDYRGFFSNELKPDFLRRGKNGQIYSIHSPGLPTLVLPAFAVGGYAGVLVFLSLISALGTWLLWRAAYRITGSGGAAWFGWACAALSVPFFVHAFLVYPDAACAGVVVAAVYALICCEPDAEGRTGPAVSEWGRGRWLLLGAALATLPWLHTRYAGLEAILAACVALRLLKFRRFGSLLALVTVPVLGALAWFGYFEAIYGEFNPSAPYGRYTQAAVANIARGLPALLFDQQFGALPNAPACALGVFGLVSLFRTRRRLAIELAVVVVSYLLLVSTYYMWWGGLSAPARFAVPVLLVLGVPAASFWERQRIAGRVIGAGVLVLTVLITTSLVVVQRGDMLFNHRDGFALWLEWLSPVVDLPRALPSFFRDSTGGALTHAAVWAAMLAVATLVVRTIGRRRGADGTVSAASVTLWASVCFAVAVMAATAANWAMEGVTGSTPTTSVLSLLRAYDPARRPLGASLTPAGRIPLDQLLQGLSLPASNRRPAGSDGALLELSEVPAGTYRLSPESLGEARGEVTVTAGGSRTGLARWPIASRGDAAHDEFTLPVGATELTLSGDDAARGTMPRIALQPVRVAVESRRFVAPAAAFACAYDGMTAFAFDPGVYLEGPGIWVSAGQPYSIAFAGVPGASSIRLVVRNAPVANRVTLRSQATEDVFEMKAGEIRVLDVPVDAANGGALVEITAERGFRPAEVDKNTQDRRYLGVWIQSPPR